MANPEKVYQSPALTQGWENLKDGDYYTFDEALPTARVDLEKGDLKIGVEFFLDHMIGRRTCSLF